MVGKYGPRSYAGTVRQDWTAQNVQSNLESTLYDKKIFSHKIRFEIAAFGFPLTVKKFHLVYKADKSFICNLLFATVDLPYFAESVV